MKVNENGEGALHRGVSGSGTTGLSPIRLNTSFYRTVLPSFAWKTGIRFCSSYGKPAGLPDRKHQPEQGGRFLSCICHFDAKIIILYAFGFIFMIGLLYENIIKAELTVVNKTGTRCCFFQKSRGNDENRLESVGSGRPLSGRCRYEKAGPLIKGRFACPEVKCRKNRHSLAGFFPARKGTVRSEKRLYEKEKQKTFRSRRNRFLLPD